MDNELSDEQGSEDSGNEDHDEEDAEEELGTHSEDDYKLDFARDAIDQEEIEETVTGVETVYELSLEDDKLGRHAITKVRRATYCTLY